MKVEDFKLFARFTPDEVLATGATIESVRLELMESVAFFRDIMARPVILLPNGLTSGNHKSVWHAKGLAADVGFREIDGPVDPQEVVINAVVAGFKGIGAYWNEFAYSFHLDKRPALTMWRGLKNHREVEWRYSKLIQLP